MTPKQAQDWIDSQPDPERYSLDIFASGNKVACQIIDHQRFSISADDLEAERNAFDSDLEEVERLLDI